MPGQQQALARAFGCARVVYNDCLRVRDQAHAAGEKISDTEVQRRVVTVARQTPERAWLGEVASVALVQACQDARRAYRNWFDSVSGKRKGRKVRHPAFRSKHRRQSIRLTRNGFALHGERLYVAKVGDIKVAGLQGRLCQRPHVLAAPEPMREDHHQVGPADRRFAPGSFFAGAECRARPEPPGKARSRSAPPSTRPAIGSRVACLH